MKNDSNKKNEQAATGGNVSSLGTAGHGSGEPVCTFAETIDFLTLRVRALIQKVGSRKPTAAEQHEAQELRGRLAALKREAQKFSA